MKIQKWVSAAIICTLNLYGTGNPAQFIKNNQLIIGADSERGFFGCFISALNNIAWCEKNNVTPIVHWDEHSCYYDPTYNEQTKNGWEYYFEQVSTSPYERSAIQWQGWFDLSGEGISLLKDLGTKYSTKKYRTSVNALIKKYIKIKPPIAAKVEHFYQNHFAGKKTIGMHMRGTDKFTEVKPVSIDTFVNTAQNLSARYPDCQFFIATDEESILQEMKSRFPGRVIYYDSYRSSTGQPLHTHTQGYSKAKLGEEVLIEALLLARCDAFIHTVSNVSMAVLFLNPELENILLKNTAKKIAFLFLTIDDVYHEKIWRNFFAGQEQHYSFYVHAKNTLPDHSFFKKGEMAHTVLTTWANTMNAQIELLKEALKDPAHEKFIFVSESTIPLKSFSEVYNAVMKTPHSIFNYFNNRHPYRTFGPYKNDTLYKNAQWVILNKKHARLMAHDTKVIKLMTQDPHDQEHYPSTFLAEQGLLSEVKKQDTTLALWTGEHGNAHPHNFSNLATDPYLPKLIKAIQNKHMLFARKFDRNCDLSPLKEYLPLIDW